MEYLIVGIAALVGAGLTLFSGFGLGTLLLAVLVLFFPPSVAIAVTAIVHFLNNLFKFGLLGMHADRSIVLRFGLPAIAGAWFGAQALVLLTDFPPLWTYMIAGEVHAITPVKLGIGILLLAFALLELFPRAHLGSLPRRYLPLGGLLSGFFGGLSGHQGALRSMFLLKAGLNKEAFVATGIVIALFIDVTRLSTYFTRLDDFDWQANILLLALATVAAFVGSFFGSRLLHKITVKAVQYSVVVLLLLISLGLSSGLL